MSDKLQCENRLTFFYNVSRSLIRVLNFANTLIDIIKSRYSLELFRKFLNEDGDGSF